MSEFGQSIRKMAHLLLNVWTSARPMTENIWELESLSLLLSCWLLGWDDPEPATQADTVARAPKRRPLMWLGDLTLGSRGNIPRREYLESKHSKRSAGSPHEPYTPSLDHFCHLLLVVSELLRPVRLWDERYCWDLLWKI